MVIKFPCSRYVSGNSPRLSTVSSAVAPCTTWPSMFCRCLLQGRVLSFDEGTNFRQYMTELLELSGGTVPDGLEGPEWDSAAQAAAIASLPEEDPWPEAMIGAVIRAVVNDPHPAAYNQLLKHAVTAARRRQVMEALINVLENGTSTEKEMAAEAWYWSQPALIYKGELENLLSGTPAIPTEESQRAYDAVADLQARWNQAALREFIANEDVRVRRSVLEGLPLDPDGYPDELKELVVTAVRIVRTHPDESIRRQAEEQL